MCNSRGTIASFSYACLPPRPVRLDYNLAEGENFALTVVFGRDKLRRHHGQQPGKERPAEVLLFSHVIAVSSLVRKHWHSSPNYQFNAIHAYMSIYLHGSKPRTGTYLVLKVTKLQPPSCSVALWLQWGALIIDILNCSSIND